MNWCNKGTSLKHTVSLNRFDAYLWWTSELSYELIWEKYFLDIRKLTRVLRVPCARAHQFSAYDIKYEKRGSFCDMIFRLSNTQNKKLGFRYQSLFVILIKCLQINQILMYLFYIKHFWTLKDWRMVFMIYA